jgi:hypothetical protein
MIWEQRFLLHRAAQRRGQALNLELAHILVERDPEGALATASDRFIAACVPVELEPADVPGLVRADLWRMATALCRGDPLAWPRMRLGETSVTLSDGSVHPRFYPPRFTGERLEVKLLPRLRAKIVPRHCPVTRQPRGSFTVDPFLLAQLARALGCLGSSQSRSRPLAITRVTRSGPLLLETEAPLSSGWPCPPFGLLMPLQVINSGDRAAIQEGDECA